MSRILLVEDEPLIATMLCDWLEALGHVVVGPTGTSAQAFGLIHEAGVEAAIVDIGVQDGDAYSVADELRRLFVPFVFATGYPTDTIDSRFSGIPLLSKPFDYDCFESAVQQMTTRRIDVSQSLEASLVSARCPDGCHQPG
jgi:DNA-binding response OmpR family regulator